MDTLYLGIWEGNLLDKKYPFAGKQSPDTGRETVELGDQFHRQPYRRLNTTPNKQGGVKSFYIPALSPNEDITAECRYYIDKARERFCRYIELFFPEDLPYVESVLGSPKDRTQPMPMDQLQERIKVKRDRDISDKVLNYNEGHKNNKAALEHFAKELLELYALRLAKLYHLSEKRIELNAKYCSLLYDIEHFHDGKVNDWHRQELEEVYNKASEVTDESARVFMQLDEMDEQKILHRVKDTPVENKDIYNLLREAKSEIYKAPPIKPYNPANKIPTRGTFIHDACKLIRSQIMDNRAIKSADGCDNINKLAYGNIDLVNVDFTAEFLRKTESNMANAVRKVEAASGIDIASLIVEYVEAAKYKTAIPEHEPEFIPANEEFKRVQKLLVSDLELINPEVAPKEMVILKRNIEDIRLITESKQDLKHTVAKANEPEIAPARPPSPKIREPRSELTVLQKLLHGIGLPAH